MLNLNKAICASTKIMLALICSYVAAWAQNVSPTPTLKSDRFGVFHWDSETSAWDFSKDRLNRGADLAKSLGTKTLRVVVTPRIDTYGVNRADTVWFDDSVPAGAALTGQNEGWTWVSASPLPFFGSSSHQSAINSGVHQHWFYGATDTFRVNSSDVLFTYVYLDPANPPQEIMLQWNDGNWEHRAYWGANLLPWGADGTAARRYMGPLPPTGKWVRLEVPAASVGLGASNLNGMAFSMYGGRATWDRAGATKNEIVWVEDSIPAGAIPAADNESWDFVGSSPSQFSGNSAHQSAIYSDTHQHFFYGATNTLKINNGDRLFAYVYLDPANPPQEVMLQWNDGSWNHRAYWGANRLPWGVDETDSNRNIGPLPPTGKWVRLEVPASSVGLVGSTINGMAFSLFGGRATWDRAGVVTNETVWIDDIAPDGTTFSGYLDTWNVVTSNPSPFSGNVAHQTNVASGIHQIYVLGATDTLKVNVGDILFTYVYLDPSNPPQEVMLQWYENGSWEHRAFWGAGDLIGSGCGGCGALHTNSRRRMGALPSAGRWVRLEVPAYLVGLEGKTVSGFAFTLYNGRAAFDRLGKVIDLVQTVASPAYDELFRSPDFNTFVISVFRTEPLLNTWLDADGFTPSAEFPMSGAALPASDREIERNEVGRLGDYLLYPGRYPGKKFIFLNWEGDHAFWDLPGENVDKWDDFQNWIQSRADGVAESRARNTGSSAKLYSGVEFYLAQTLYYWTGGTATYDSNGVPVGDIRDIRQANEPTDLLKPRVPCGTPSENSNSKKYWCVSSNVAPNVTVDYYSYSASSNEITGLKLFSLPVNLRDSFKDLFSTRNNPSGNNPHDKSVLKKIQAGVNGMSVGEQNFIIGEWGFGYKDRPNAPNWVGEMMGAFNLGDPNALHPSYLIYYQTVGTTPGYGGSCTGEAGDGLFQGCNSVLYQTPTGVAFANGITN